MLRTLLRRLRGRSRRDLQQTASASPCWPLDRPMVMLTPTDTLSIRDLCEGVLVLGNPGSGKSSTSGTILPLAALHDGWGLAAFTTKPDDLDFWRALCHQAGREPIIVAPGGAQHFNLIRYELERTSPGGGSTLRLAGLLMEIFREGRPQATTTDTSEFFEQQGRITLCNAIDSLRLASEPVTFRSLWRLIESAPKQVAEMMEEPWHQGYCYEVLARADGRVRTAAELELNETVGTYFTQTLPNMNERTRGDVLATIESALFQLSREPVRDLLDDPRGCSFLPESLDDGAVLLVDCPASVHGHVGRMLSICFKRLVKESLRRRTVRGDLTRPVMLCSDECQTYCTRDDADFFQVCRSNRIATVFLTQSIDNLEAVLGSQAHTDSLAGALTTHIYHCTSGRTAEWIERRIAQTWRDMHSMNFPGAKDGVHSAPGFSVSESLHAQVLASELTRLRTGGPLNHRLVDAIVFKPGRRFHASGAPFLRVQFEQS